MNTNYQNGLLLGIPSYLQFYSRKLSLPRHRICHMWEIFLFPFVLSNETLNLNHDNHLVLFSLWDVKKYANKSILI